MKKVLIVKMSGKAQSGKDYSTDYLKSKLPNDLVDVYSFAFADPVKEIAHAYLESMGIPIDKKSDAVRKLYQAIGDTTRKVLGQDVWIHWMQKQVNNVLRNLDENDSRPVIIFMTDTRYENELTYMFRNYDVSLKTLVIRLSAPVKLEGDIAEHPSETGLDHYSTEQLEALVRSLGFRFLPINNNKTLKDLDHTLDSINLYAIVDVTKYLETYER
jgi:hypothetical protein